jgi:hypothetical protein
MNVHMCRVEIIFHYTCAQCGASWAEAEQRDIPECPWCQLATVAVREDS